MNIILLSGGSGQRLWPLSNTVRSKQFIPLLCNEDGICESMVQRVYRQITTVDPDTNVIIATGKRQVGTIKHQLGDKVSICIEPCRRDTFPAIALASTYLANVKKVNPDEPVVVCPVDPYVNLDYFEAVKKLAELAAEGKSNLSLLGISPLYPSSSYGYIMPESKDEVSSVKCFIEKPNVAAAAEYIEQGALWNGGVFAYKLSYLLRISKELLGSADYQTLYENYEKHTKISFDYAVVEKESNIRCLRFSGEWKDVGSWDAFTDVMDNEAIGNIQMVDCVNTNVINQLDLPVICVGLKDTVVAVGCDGILVSDKMKSSSIKPYVDKLDPTARFEEKAWGSFTILDIQPESLTIKIILHPGNKLNYHSHEYRDEVWTVISGTGYAVVDEKKRQIKAGDVVILPVGSRHAIHAISELQVIEVQMGVNLDVKDKIKYNELCDK